MSTMDALIRKVKKNPSPNASKGDSGVVRHEKLGEGWAENKQPVAEDSGVVFHLKYLGLTLMDEVDGDDSYGDGASATAVQRIIAMAKSEGKKLKKVALTVSSKGIHVVDIITKEVISDLSIYRISFCTADKCHDKVFAYIARSTVNETMECRAFLCAKAKIAKAVTLTVWQAFNVAEDRWTEQQHKKALRSKDQRNKNQQVSSQPSLPLVDVQVTHHPTPHQHHIAPPPLSSPFKDSFADYNLSDDSTGNGHTASCLPKEDEEEENLEDCFSELAELRGRGRVPSFSTDLRQEDLDAGVHHYMNSQHCFEEFSRQKSMEDLVNL